MAPPEEVVTFSKSTASLISRPAPSTRIPPPGSGILPPRMVRPDISTKTPWRWKTRSIPPPLMMVVAAPAPVSLTSSKMSRSPVSAMSSSAPRIASVKVPAGRTMSSAPRKRVGLHDGGAKRALAGARRAETVTGQDINHVRRAVDGEGQLREQRAGQRDQEECDECGYVSGEHAEYSTVAPASPPYNPAHSAWGSGVGGRPAPARASKVVPSAAFQRHGLATAATSDVLTRRLT